MISNQQNCNDNSRCKPFFGWWRRCIITKRGRFTKSIWYLWLHAKNGSYLRCLVAFYRLWKEIMLHSKPTLQAFWESKTCHGAWNFDDSKIFQCKNHPRSVVLKHNANVCAFQYTFITFFKWLSELQRYESFRENILKFVKWSFIVIIVSL